MSDVRNRIRLARERAGLSVGQAAKLLGVERSVIEGFETADVQDIYEEGITFAGRCAELYQVRLEWMLGEVEQHDYATADAMKGADRLTSGDRDTIAEFAASMPRGKATTARAKLKAEHWLTKIENLKAGDRCEFQFPARPGWNPAVVLKNGGPGFWAVRDESGEVHRCLYIEHIRLPGQIQAWPR